MRLLASCFANMREKTCYMDAFQGLISKPFLCLIKRPFYFSSQCSLKLLIKLLAILVVVVVRFFQVESMSMPGIWV